MKVKRYAKKRYASSRSRFTKPSYAKRYTKYRKVYKAKRSYRRTTKERAPKPPYCGTPKYLLRRQMKLSEDFVYIYTGSQSYNASGQSAQVQYQVATISDLQLAHATDLNSICNAYNQGGANSSNQSVILKAASHEVTFTNQDTQPCFFNVWVVRCKRDVPQVAGGTANAERPAMCWQSGVENMYFGNIATYTTTNPTSNALGYRNPASDPSDSTLFCRYYYVVKKMKFQLLPGGSKVVKYHAANLPWKFLDGIDGSIDGGTQGITMAILYQVLGSPFVSNQSATTNGAYYSNPQFSVMELKRYKVATAATPVKTLNYNSNWAIAVPTIPTSNQLCINPLVGVDNLYGLPVVGTAPGTDSTGKALTNVLVVEGTGGTSATTAVGTRTTT